MGLQKYTIYKYVKTDRGWRYCRPAFASNNKIKPNVVMAKGQEETHAEGFYFFQVDGGWERVSNSAVEAQEQQKKRLARQWYQQQTGEKFPEAAGKGTSLRDALDAHFGGLELKVASRNRKRRTLALMKQTLNECAQKCEVRHLHEITAAHMGKYTAWTIQNSPMEINREINRA